MPRPHPAEDGFVKRALGQRAEELVLIPVLEQTSCVVLTRGLSYLDGRFPAQSLGLFPPNQHLT